MPKSFQWPTQSSLIWAPFSDFLSYRLPLAYCISKKLPHVLLAHNKHLCFSLCWECPSRRGHGPVPHCLHACAKIYLLRKAFPRSSPSHLACRGCWANACRVNETQLEAECGGSSACWVPQPSHDCVLVCVWPLSLLLGVLKMVFNIYWLKKYLSKGHHWEVAQSLWEKFGMVGIRSSQPNPLLSVVRNFAWKNNRTFPL